MHTLIIILIISQFILGRICDSPVPPTWREKTLIYSQAQGNGLSVTKELSQNALKSLET